MGISKDRQTVHIFSRISKGIIYNKEGGQLRGREKKRTMEEGQR